MSDSTVSDKLEGIKFIGMRHRSVAHVKVSLSGLKQTDAKLDTCLTSRISFKKTKAK